MEEMKASPRRVAASAGSNQGWSPDGKSYSERGVFSADSFDALKRFNRAEINRKVCIIGGRTKDFKTDHYPRAEGWEVWGLNDVHPGSVPESRYDRWFNLHRYEHLQRDWAAGLERQISWANHHPEVPLYILDSWNDKLPNRRLFPRVMGFPRDSYHAGSFDMMVAFAIMQGFQRIILRGVDLADPHAEPISARACLEYWIGFADARNIKVNVGPDCELLAQYHLVKSQTTYGWDDIKLVVSD